MWLVLRGVEECPYAGHGSIPKRPPRTFARVDLRPTTCEDLYYRAQILPHVGVAIRGGYLRAVDGKKVLTLLRMM
jgi:hypothetical protein